MEQIKCLKRHERASECYWKTQLHNFMQHCSSPGNGQSGSLQQGLAPDLSCEERGVSGTGRQQVLSDEVFTHRREIQSTSKPSESLHNEQILPCIYFRPYANPFTGRL